MRILVTGGHATPAIACINELKLRGYSDIVYVGQKKSILFDKNVSAEYRQITEKVKIPFYNLIAGKASRYFDFASFVWFLRIPIGFVQAFFLILLLRPSLVLTFGSHVGVPICFWAKIFRLPIIAHEQTTTIGRSNKFIQKLATKVCYSWEKTNFEGLETTSDKFILTGNPVRKEILQSFSNIFNFANPSRKLLFITGGNQGAHILNEWIFANLKVIATKYNIIHQTGSNTLYNDFEKAERSALEINKNGLIYIPQRYIFSENMGEVLAKADFIVSRAGANSLIEFVILRKKALLIPIPTTSGNEQFLNAKVLENLGLGLVLDQNNLDQIDLIKELENLQALQIDEENSKIFANLHLEAEKKIVDLIEQLIS